MPKGVLSTVESAVSYTHLDVYKRQWLSFPVQSRDDFLKMKERYDSKDPERIPQNFKERAKILNLEMCIRDSAGSFQRWP